MKITRLNILFTAVLLSVLFLSSCKTGRRAGQTIRLKEKSSKFLLKKLASNRIEADHLSAKAKINYKDDNESVKFTANFRYIKDSIIWLNVKKTTVEAIRLQITPDSFFLIDRLNKEYFISSIEKIEERFNLPQRTAADLSTFDLLQEMLLGNPVFFAGTPLKSAVDEGEYSLTGESEHFKSEYRLEGINYLLTVMNFIPDDERQMLQVAMDRSDGEDDYPKFSYFRTYNMTTPERGDVEIKIKFSKLELNTPKNIRFEIPKKYKRID